MLPQCAVWVVWVGLVAVPLLWLSATNADQDLLDKLNKYNGLLVAIFTLLLVLFTALLWRVTRLQAQTARASQRAYVAINPAGIEYLEPAWQILGHVVFENAGHLPAGNFRWRIRIEFGDQNWAPPLLASADLEADAVLPVGAKWKMGSPTMQRQIAHGYVFVWGRVEYTDGFGGSRFTNFCHRYRWAGPATTTRKPSDARFHKSGNEGD